MSDSFFLRPFDSLLLRTGHPNLGGEPTVTAAHFPPSPWTWQGMIRTHILTNRHSDLLRPGGDVAKKRAEIEKIVGPPDRLPPGWRLRGPFPALTVGGQQEPWVSWPAFLSAAPEDQAPTRSKQMDLAGVQRFSSSPAALTLLGWEGGRSAGRGWISASNLRWALRGGGDWQKSGSAETPKSRTQAESLPPFVYPERRPGLQIDADTHLAVDHMLYTALHHRFDEDAGLWGALLGADKAKGALTHGLATVGRKSRLASLEPGAPVSALTELLNFPGDLRPSPNGLHLRVVLLSPAPVTDGPAPFALPPGVLLRGLQGGTGPDIGGYDLQGKDSRPVRRTWAAGTTAWVFLPGDHPDWSGALRQLAGEDNLTDDERFGFGQRVIAPFEPTTGNPLPLEASRA